MELLSQPVFTVLFYSMITAAATGLGAIPFFFITKMSRKWLGISNAIAAGLMLAASFNLVYEGLAYSQWMTTAGVFTGLLFIVGSQQVIDRYNGEMTFTSLPKADASKILLIIAIMTIHSFTEGVSVGVSFSGNLELGLFITTAIAMHNIPEGLAISLVMVPRGTSPLKAAGWSVFSSLPQPLMAVPAFLFVELFQTYLPMGLGFAGGAMIWMIFAELIPDANEDAEPRLVATTVALSVVAMLILQILI